MIRSAAALLWMALGWVELAAWTLLLYPLSYLPGAPRPWYRRLFRIWCRVWTHALGVELHLHQKNRRPLPARFILIANHPSAFEDLAIPAWFDVDNLAKAEVREWWIVGRISAAAGTLYVQRESRSSRAAAAAELLEAVRAGRNVALYPEGGVKGKRVYGMFHYGAFDVSLRTGIPILPVFIHYEAQDDFYWGPESLPRKIFNIMRASNHRANYYLHDAFDPGAFRDKRQYCDHVHRQYLAWQSRYLD